MRIGGITPVEVHYREYKIIKSRYQCP